MPDSRDIFYPVNKGEVYLNGHPLQRVEVKRGDNCWTVLIDPKDKTARELFELRVVSSTRKTTHKVKARVSDHKLSQDIIASALSLFQK